MDFWLVFWRHFLNDAMLNFDVVWMFFYMCHYEDSHIIISLSKLITIIICYSLFVGLERWYKDNRWPHKRQNLPPPPSYLIIPIYLCRGGTGCHTDTTDHIEDRLGWVGTPEPFVHPGSRCDLCPVLRFWQHGILLHNPNQHCGNDHIYIPTGCLLRDFYVLPTGESTHYVPSKSSNPRHRWYYTSAREHPYHTLPYCGWLSGCNPLWPVLLGGSEI